MKQVAERSALNKAARFDNFAVKMPHQDTGLRAAQTFVEEAKRDHPLALVLYSYPQDTYSGYGVGKTHLASAVAFELAERDWVIQTWLAPDLFSKLRASYSKDSEIQEHAILHPARAADLLIVDDVGKENARKEWRQDLYFQIIDARYRNGPIVITTNLHAIEEFPAHIGEAAYSRLWEMSRTKWWVDMTGPDWRVRIAKGDD
jgi:DNA replication protein DnaC